MASFNEEIDLTAEKYLNDYAEQLTNDTPTIEVAIKNLMAVLLSKSLHPHDFKSNDSDIDNNELENVVFEPTVVIKCAKIVVKIINELELMEPIEEENQTADNRLDQIAQYKVAFNLVNKMKTFNQNTNDQKSGKIYKLFGRKLLQWTHAWNNIKEKVIFENIEIDHKILMYFLDSFSHSIEVNNQSNHEENDFLRNDQELIWCSNFNGLLIERQEKRRIAATTRLIQQQEILFAEHQDD